MANIDKFLVSNSTNFIKSRVVNIRLWHDDDVLDAGLFYSEFKGVNFGNHHYKFKFIPKTIHFQNLENAYPDYQKAQLLKNTDTSNFFQYFLQAIKFKSKELELPQEIIKSIDDYIVSSDFLKQSKEANLRRTNQQSFLTNSCNFISFDSPYASIEGQKYTRQEFEATQAIGSNLRIFIEAHNACVQYIEKNIELLSKILGPAIVSSRLEDYSGSTYYSDEINQRKYSNLRLLDLEMVKIFDNSESYCKFKHDKEEKRYFDSRAEICQNIEAALRAELGLDKAKKEANKFLFIDKSNVQHYENANLVGLYEKDKNNILGNSTEKNNKSALLIISRKKIDLKKFVPPLIKKNVTLNFLLDDFPSYSLEAIEHQDRYGSRNLFYVYASVNSSVAGNTYKKGGFFKNKTGTMLTTDLSEAFGFSSLNTAQEFSQKADYSPDFDFSFVKTRLELVDITGAKPSHDKEFMSYLTQWEKESLTKIIDNSTHAESPSLPESNNPAPEAAPTNLFKKRNKI